MKKIISCILIAVLLCSAAAFAEVPKLSENMFKYAKNAVLALANGRYDKLVTSLPFSDVSPRGDEWRELAEGAFSDLPGSEPQTLYAVAYWMGTAWKIAVPVFDPVDAEIETLELISADGKTFNGYNFALWGQVAQALQASPYVAWNQEFISSTSVFIENDF